MQGSPSTYKVGFPHLCMNPDGAAYQNFCLHLAQFLVMCSIVCARFLPCSVSSLAFNSSGTLLAMAVSYMFERGPQPGQPKPQIIVRAVREEDVRPKS